MVLNVNKYDYMCCKKEEESESRLLNVAVFKLKRLEKLGVEIPKICHGWLIFKIFLKG